MAGKSTLNRLEPSTNVPTPHHKIGHDAAAISGPDTVTESILSMSRLPRHGQTEMSAIKQMPSGKWNADVRRKGHPRQTRTFDTEREAREWAEQVETEMDADLTTANTAPMMQVGKWKDNASETGGSDMNRKTEARVGVGNMVLAVQAMRNFIPPLEHLATILEDAGAPDLSAECSDLAGRLAESEKSLTGEGKEAYPWIDWKNFDSWYNPDSG